MEPKEDSWKEADNYRRTKSDLQKSLSLYNFLKKLQKFELLLKTIHKTEAFL